MEREIVRTTEEDEFDYTGKNDVTIDGKEYKFIESNPTTGDGGEARRVIYQRVSDGKYFEYEWEYCGGDYYYEPEWYEVKLLKQIIKNVYGWKS